ncbi:MAG: hypothetical protein ABIH87_04670 [bacterium]
MVRFNDHQKALQMRGQGMSYSQIKNELNISKSTLSYWLRNFPLPKKRIQELRDRNEGRIEKFRNTMRLKKEKRLEQIYKIQKQNIFPLDHREMLVAGLFLYWGEGTKSHTTDISLSNTDPAMINFFIKWVVEYLKVPRAKLKVHLQLYEDMNINKEINFWSNITKLSKKQFTKPYIKKTILKNIKHNRGGFGHGTCNIRINDTRLAEKILMSINVLGDTYK